ncbi:MAG: rhombosortase [Planctomycetota bacterium]
MTLALVLASLAAQPFASSLKVDRDVTGELWRWLTGHLVHWNTSHQLWDVVMTAVFGIWLERLSRRAMMIAVVLALLYGSMVFATVETDLATYRGLSGIACGLVAACGVVLWQRGDLLASLVLLVGLVAKVLGEVIAGDALFVDGTFESLPSVHIAGAAAGIVATFCRGRPGDER